MNGAEKTKELLLKVRSNELYYRSSNFHWKKQPSLKRSQRVKTTENGWLEGICLPFWETLSKQVAFAVSFQGGSFSSPKNLVTEFTTSFPDRSSEVKKPYPLENRRLEVR